MGNKLFSINDTVSNEMIDEQLDDKVITDLTSKFVELIDLSDRFSHKLVTSISYFRFPETKKVIEEIDNIIYKRFGFSIKHISAENIGYAVLTVPPVNFNVLAGDVVDIFDYFKDYLGKDKTKYDDKYEVKEKDVKTKHRINDIFKDEKSVVYHTYMSYNKLEKTLHSSSVKIDLNKAKISNLPNEYNLFIMVDLFMLIRKYKLTGRELSAVLLHEIGHGFTHLEYSYRTVKNTTLLIDNIRDSINSGKSKLESFNLVYKNILKGDEDISKVNEYTAIIKIFDKYMQNNMLMNMNDRHSFTDSEQLADQFANRFGVGDALVTSLAKLHGDFNRGPRNPSLEILLSVISLAIILVGLLFSLVLLPIFLIFIIIVLLVGGPDSNANVYDTKIRRYQRIKNDMIKIIRTTDLDNSIIKTIIEEIDIVDKIMEKSKSEITLMDKIADKFFPFNSKISNFKKLEELLEDMSENNLYLASNKLRTLK